MANVAEVLAGKGSHVHSVAPEATVYDAISRMIENNVGSMLVTDGTSIAGIFTERDYLRRVTLEGRDPRATRVSEVMTRELICVDPDRTVQDCMVMMTQERIRHLPVVDGERVVGVISIGDLVKHLSKEQAVEIRYLTDYITGKL